MAINHSKAERRINLAKHGSLNSSCNVFRNVFFAIAFYYIIYRKTSPMISIQEHLHQLLQAVSPSKMLQIFMCLDVLFEHFKHSSNKPSPRCQSKKLHCTTQFQLLKQWMACSNIMERKVSRNVKTPASVSTNVPA